MDPDRTRDRASRRPVPRLRAAPAAAGAGAARAGVVSVVRARRDPPGRRIPVRQRGRSWQRGGRGAVLATHDADRGRARGARDLDGRRHRRRGLPPALRPQRTECAAAQGGAASRGQERWEEEQELLRETHESGSASESRGDQEQTLPLCVSTESDGGTLRRRGSSSARTRLVQRSSGRTGRL